MRFLTPDSKRDILAQWEREKQAWRVGEIKGPGEPDTDIVPCCDAINALSGICTLQSCAGHRKGRYQTNGHLWLWMDEVAHARFTANAFLLLNNQDYIDSVDTRFLHDGKEIAFVAFFGNERGKLDASMTFIYGFLCGIASEKMLRPAVPGLFLCPTLVV